MIGLLLALLLPVSLDAAYFKTIVSDINHPQMSAGATFNSRFSPIGGIINYSIIYHPADADDSLIPGFLLRSGVRPISWSLLDVGVGGASGNFIAPVGASINLTPTVLGPLVDYLGKSESSIARGIGNIISGPNGGVAFGPKWVAYPVVDSVVVPVTQWRFPPGWFVGGMWTFGTQK